MRSWRWLLALAAIAMLFATGCAEANLAEANATLCQREMSGFFWGFAHGVIAPVSFVGSLFDADIAVYDICNVGGWYDFGFCLGIGAFSSGSHTAASSATDWTDTGDKT